MHEIDQSLRRLGTDYVDLYQIHRWDSANADRGDDGGAARRREGGEGALHRRVVDVGLAVLEGAARRRAARVDEVRLDAEPLQPRLPRGGARDAPAVCRPGRRCHPVEPARPRPAHPRRGHARPIGPRPTSSGAPSTRSADAGIVEAVAKIAADRGVSRAQIALAWVLEAPGGHRTDRRGRRSRSSSKTRSPRSTSSSPPTRSRRSSRPTHLRRCRASPDPTTDLPSVGTRAGGSGCRSTSPTSGRSIADEVGDRTALIHGDERVSWRELRRPGRPARAGVRRARPAARLEGRALPLQRDRVRRRAVRGVQDARCPDQRQLPLHRQRAALPARELRQRGAVLPLEPR